MKPKELADILARNLPITSENAEMLIDAILKGYMFDKIDYPMALCSRDRTIRNLMNENREILEKRLK